MHELRCAWRALWRRPGITLVVVLSLGAGIGVNTVVFSWIQWRLIEPIPGVRGGAAVRLIEPKTDAGLYSGSSWPEFLDMRRELGSFEQVFAARMAPLYVGPPGSVERVFGLLASDNYFPALGVRPARGRFFRPEEVSQPGREPVVIVSYRLWQSMLGAVADLGGVTLRVNGADLAVIGVTPPEFQGTTLGLQFDAWLPATLAAEVAGGPGGLEQRQVRGYGVMGLLRAGTSPAEAAAEVEAFMRRLAERYPSTNRAMTAEVLAYADSPRGPQRMLTTALLVLQAVMLLLLLAVCGNVATLLLARASARRREMGVRAALGAGGMRLAGLVAAESLLLGLAGAALGAVLAVWGTQGLLVLPLTGLPIRFETRIDALGLTVAIGLGVACAVVSALAPALHVARVDPQAALRTDATAGGRSLLRQAVLGVQVALAMAVLIVAGLFVRAFLDTRTEDPGFDRDGVLLATYDLSGRPASPDDSRRLADRVLEAVGRVPGVLAVAVATSVPLDIHGLPVRVVNVEGRARDDGGFDESLSIVTTPGYFDVMRIPFLAGRDFQPLGDPAAARQAIVNQAFVDRFIAPGEPIGRHVTSRGGEYVIAGVVRTSLANAFGEPPTPVIYFSYRDQPQPRGEIHVRTAAGDPAGVARGVRQAVRDLDADLPVFNVRSLAEHVDTNLIFRRIPARMFSVLGPLLVALAAVGIYAVVSYAVSLRRSDVGVRVALGASQARVTWPLVADSFSAALAGAAMGWALALVGASDVMGDRQLDWLVFGTVPGVLLAVVWLASWIPARRAARMDPVAALRP